MPKISKVGKFRKAAAASKKVALAPLGKDAYLVVPKKEKDEVPSSAGSPSQNDKGSEQQPNTAAGSADNSSLSRGQRKRQAKREQYLKKEKMIMSSLQLKEEDEQKKRIDGLDALKEALMETAAKSSAGTDASSATKTKPASTITSNKAKQQILSSELNHMSLVLQHPSFQSNPFEALQEHLRNSLAKQGKEQQAASVVRIQKETKAKALRKQDKKDRLRQATFKGKKKGRSKFKATRSRGGK